MIRTGAARRLPKLHTSRYCIAYLDFLGAEKSMQKNDEKFLNDLNSVYYNALHDVEFTNVVTQKDINVKIFSDNILLAVKIEINDPNRCAKIEKIIDLTATIYNDALRHGYLIRGSITEGEFYKDDSNVFVYGKALIDAINLEEKIAIYPRIVVQHSIKELKPLYFVQDTDGVWYLNSFIYTGIYDYVTYKHQLLNMLQKFSKDEKVRQKIMWAIYYYNFYFKTQKQRDSISYRLIKGNYTDNDILIAEADINSILAKNGELVMQSVSEENN